MKLENANSTAPLKAVDRIEKLEKEVANLSMATRISQMLLKQLMERGQQQDQELRSLNGMLNDYQYRFLALQQSIPGLDITDVAVKADAIKLNDWNDASDRDDSERKFTVADTVVDASNIVIFKSSVPSPAGDKGIFRSKIALTDTGSQDTINAFLNKKVGDEFTVKLGNEDHLVTLLGVRVAPPAQETPVAEAVS
jgi:hypothetical protein